MFCPLTAGKTRGLERNQFAPKADGLWGNKAIGPSFDDPIALFYSA